MSAVEAVETSRPVPAGSSPELVLQGLYERHSERIFGFCLRRLRTRPEAEDAVQNTFLLAFRALQRGVVPLCEHAWLFKIAENVCLSAHRSNGRRREHELGSDPDAVDALTAGEDKSETARDLERALAALPETQRRALLMREWRGLSYREIATQLGTSVAAVETLIFRARRGVVRTLNGEAGVKSRLAGVLNLGSLLGSLKTALGGATAAKLAAAAAVVTIAALPSGDAARATSKPAVAPGSAQVSAAEPRNTSGPAPGTRTQDGRIAETRLAGAPDGRPGQKRVTVPGSKPTGPAGQGDEQWGDAVEPEGGPPAGAPEPRITVPSLPVDPSLPGPPAVPPLPTVPPPPTLPSVEVPALPQVPELPKLPELPKAPALPAVPELPKLPAQLPDVEETLPELPKLP
jgi:RNA polymerase sigma factor (sigma-70 family)